MPTETFTFKRPATPGVGVTWHPMARFVVQDAEPHHRHRPNAKVETTFLVDTGAFMASVPPKLGEQLGFAPRAPGERLHTEELAGGTQKYLLRDMNVTLQKGHTPVKVPVGWIQDRPHHQRLVAGPSLGRLGLTDHFDIKMSERSNSMTFTARDNIWKHDKSQVAKIT
eukprot:PhM_4_TR8845/c0_g1_i1/m.56006